MNETHTPVNWWTQPISLWPRDAARHLRGAFSCVVLFAYAFSAWGENASPIVDPPSTNASSPGVLKLNHWQFHWQDGLYYQWRTQLDFGGTNGVFKSQLAEEVKLSGKIGGLLQLDAAGYNRQSGDTDYQDGVELRRFRMYARGEWELLLPTNYKIQIGYDNPDFVLYDFYFWWDGIPWVEAVKLGYFKVPMTLSGYASSANTLMMETASPVEAFYPSQRTGLQLGGPEFNKRATWALAFLSVGQQQDSGNASSSDLQIVTRLTGLPFYVDEEGQVPRFLHLGVSGNYSLSSGSDVQFRSRPESHLAPYVVDTGTINARDSFIFGGEAAYVHGPFSLQAELMRTYVILGDGNSTAEFKGAYVTGSLFLTGESRPYNPDTGLFLSVRPRHNFSLKTKGVGALELVAQVSHLDLTSAGIDGGEMYMAGAGLNWYWTPVTRLQFNSLFNRVNGGATPGDAFIFQARLQVSF